MFVARSLVAVAALAVGVKAQDNSTTVSSSQYWHEKYHGILSMAAYGDYNNLCPQFFDQASLLASFPDSTEAPWTVVEEWGPTASGLEGFSVVIPEMDKVVMVFKGIYGWEQFNMTAAPVPFGITGCGANCTVHQGALTSYLEAQNATNDWAVVKSYVASTGHQWSVTGHAFGGMVAQVAALDLGWRGLCHWTHNHGSARVFSPTAADIYNSLFEGEASQRVVANDDSVPAIIPESADYTFTLQGFHITGNGTGNSTYGMSYEICADSPTNPACLGGNNATDSLFYYTPIGECSSHSATNISYNETLQASFLSSESVEFYQTATSTFLLSSATPSSSALSSSALASSAIIPTSASPAEDQASATQTSTSAASSSTRVGAAEKLRSTSVGLLLVAAGFAWAV